MIRIQLTITDPSQVRFRYSALTETVLSVRALASVSGLHTPWVRQVRPRLGDADVDIDLLGALVRPAGYIPEFLLPPVTAETTGFDAGLALVGGTDPEVAGQQLRNLGRHVVATREPEVSALLRELAADPATALNRVTTHLRRYWTVAVEPYWPRIRTLLEADVTYRHERLAESGLGPLFRSLHPLVALRGEFLEITKAWDGTVSLGQRGLLLVPSVFAWPDVVVRSVDPCPVVVYSPRGLGRLWEATGPGTRRASALAELIGRSRAAVLAQLDLPMTTTQLAGLLGLTPPTLSVHLKTLQATGIVTARRDGQVVLYRRTPLGDQLLGDPTGDTGPGHRP